MRDGLIVGLLMWMASPALANEAKGERWQTLWEKQAAQTATWEGAAYEQRLIASHNAFWPSLYAKCSAAAIEGGIDEFNAVAVIDAEGKVIEFVISSNNQELNCFSKEMVGRKYPAPPVAPFHEGFTITLTKH